MFKAIFIKSSLVFLGIFCYALFALAQSPNTAASNKSGDATQATPETTQPTVQPISSDVTSAASPSQSTVTAPNQGNQVATTQKISGDPTIKPAPAVLGAQSTAGVLPGQPELLQEEKLRMGLILRMNGFDLRKLKDIKWPPIDLLKSKDAQYADLDKIKDPKALRKRLHERCVDYVQAYENYVREQYVTGSLGIQFSINCDIYSAVLEDAVYSSIDPIFDVPNEALTRRLDLVTFAIHTATSNGSLKRSALHENYLKSYETSVFGLVGVPIQFSFLVMQILMILLFGISGFLLYRTFR